MHYDGRMEATEAAEKYRDSLRPVVAEYAAKNDVSPLYDISLVDSTPIEEMSKTVEAVESLIARYDFDATIAGGALYSTASKKHLARWLASGATEAAREVLAIRAVRDREVLTVWKFVDAGVQPDYLDRCLKAGITDSDLIAEGARLGLSLEYLETMK